VAGSSDSDAEALLGEAVVVPQPVEVVAVAVAASDAWARPEAAAELGAAELPPAAGQAGQAGQAGAAAARPEAAGAAQDVAAAGPEVVEAAAPAAEEQPPAEAVGAAAWDAAGQRLAGEAAPGVAEPLRAAAPSVVPWVLAFRPGQLRPVGARPGRRRRARSARGKWSSRWASPKGRSWQAARDEA